jgi:RNA polymerase sigma-70 factor (ECF subfamily)
MAFTTRGSLLSAVRRGDEIGWREFYDMYKPLILLRGGDLRLNQTEKEELVQLVMLSFFNSARTFRYDRSKGRFRDYLRQVIHNRACDLMRKRQDGTVSADVLENVLAALPADTEDRWEREYRETVLKQAFEELKLRCDPLTLQSYDLFVRQGLPAREVAAMLGIKANAVYQHKSRVEEMLRRIAGELDE